MQLTTITRPQLLMTSLLAVATIACDLEPVDALDSADESGELANLDYEPEPELDLEAPTPIGDDMIIVDGDDFRVRIHPSRRVAELNVSRDHIAKWYGKPFSTWSMEASTRLYQVFEDDFDFIVFVPASEGQHLAIMDDGESVRVSNKVSGIGLEEFNDGPTYGSEGRLQSMVMLGGIKHIVGGPILRELGERWGNAFIPTASPDHWGFSDVGGQLGGCSPDSIEPVGEDIWSCGVDGPGNWSPDGAVHTDRPYSRLELYLMGLVGAEGMPDVYWADDGQWIDADLGLFSGTLRHSDMAGLVETHGKRFPTVEESQREFRTLFVVISDSDFLDQETFDSVEARVAEFAAPGPVLGEPGMLNFYEAASSLATLDVEDLDASLRP